jgi:hypothetical protein
MVFVAFLVTFIFYTLFKKKGPWESYWKFFIVVLLGMWALNIWIHPYGPSWRDVYWYPPLVTGIIIAVFLAAAVPSPKTRAVLEKDLEEREQKQSSRILAGSFFWIFILILLAIIITGII